MSKLIIFIFSINAYLYLFSFDRCRDDCAKKREEMCTPGETGFWDGGAGGGGEPQRSSIWGGLARSPIP